MDMTAYWLPDGRIVQVDSTAAKGANLITFTLKGGRIVVAVRADLLNAQDMAQREVLR